MTKWVQSGLAGIFLVLFSALWAAASPVDRIVAVVNNEIVTLSELDREAVPYLKRVAAEETNAGKKEAIVAQVRQKVLDDMIEKILIAQEAARLGITVVDAEVEKMLADTMKQRELSREQVRRMLEKEGLTVEEYKKGIRAHILKLKFMAREIKPKVVVTTDEIGDYYSKHKEMYEGKEAVRILQILLIAPPKMDSAKREALRAEAEDILRLLKSGAPFPELALRRSQGPAASTGGDLGYVEKGVMLPEVEKAAFSLRNGETSGVIETRVGFHILRVVDRRGAGLKPVEEVREEIWDRIGGEKMEKRYREWLDEQRKKAHIDVRL
ncbi:MAG TPA: peptidylprolyl isomerase [Syntrophales bacterium]|nr:peptidylprolyl isomerase [Syntrophales bacterium]